MEWWHCGASWKKFGWKACISLSDVTGRLISWYINCNTILPNLCVTRIDEKIHRHRLRFIMVQKLRGMFRVTVKVEWHIEMLRFFPGLLLLMMIFLFSFCVCMWVCLFSCRTLCCVPAHRGEIFNENIIQQSFAVNQRIVIMMFIICHDH